MQDMPSLRETVCHLVHRADSLLNRENSRALEPFGVTMYQAMGLIYVADHEQDRTVNQRALEQYTQLSNPGRHQTGDGAGEDGAAGAHPRPGGRPQLCPAHHAPGAGAGGGVPGSDPGHGPAADPQPVPPRSGRR